jgi:endonuclease-3
VLAAPRRKVAKRKTARRGRRLGGRRAAGPRATPETAREQIRLLKKLYPGARCSLDYETPFQLLVATILSAQCTDERVNQVTPGLFRRYPTPESFATEEIGEIEEAIRSTGFFRSKAKSLQEMSRDLVARHEGRVPPSMEALVRLRGVGRKTANVVLGNAFDRAEGVVVDTHVARLATRLGLTRERDPIKIERDLMAIVPRAEWSLFAHLLIHHGRAVCQARKPRCEACALDGICPKIGVGKARAKAATGGNDGGRGGKGGGKRSRPGRS